MLALTQFPLLAVATERYNPFAERISMPNERRVVMLDVDHILSQHRQTVVDWHAEPELIDNINAENAYLLISEQHAFNFRLWHEEDQARCPQATDEQIARVKRAIDGYNQQRNDWIEKIDLWILHDLQTRSVTAADDARQNTETPGSAIDRLSIMALRLYHLAEQLERDDASEELLSSIREKMDRGERQLGDLSQSLGELLSDIYAGRKRHQLYCQMKMYNDPRLNPYLVAAEKRMVG